MMKEVKGKINSFYSTGAVDGPGVRFIVFMQGCPLRCVYCHNPETWNLEGDEYTVDEVLEKVLRYKSYFKEKGGITVSGGEPLLQSQFVTELFRRCKIEKINTVLDTSGGTGSLENISELLEVTDLVLLDVKFTTEEEYYKYTKGSLKHTLEFLDYCNKLKVPVWIRQVIVNSINDTKEKVLELKEIIEKYNNIEKIELLPFKKFCIDKYVRLGIDFPLTDIEETSNKVIEELSYIING